MRRRSIVVVWCHLILRSSFTTDYFYTPGSKDHRGKKTYYYSCSLSCCWGSRFAASACDAGAVVTGIRVMSLSFCIRAPTKLSALERARYVIYRKVKYTDIAVRSLTCHTATGIHMPCMITQCYLPPGRGDNPAFTPAEDGTRLTDPRGMQG